VLDVVVVVLVAIPPWLAQQREPVPGCRVLVERGEALDELPEGGWRWWMCHVVLALLYEYVP
jgi:hypothetical protein